MGVKITLDQRGEYLNYSRAIEISRHEIANAIHDRLMRGQ